MMGLQPSQCGFQHARKGKAGGKSDMTVPSSELPVEVFSPRKSKQLFLWLMSLLLLMTTTDDCFKTEKKYINPIFSFSPYGTVF